MTRITVVGCGYVGGVSAVCFAELGHQVDCIDLNSDRVRAYRSGSSPIYEPGIDDLLRRGLASGRLAFFDTYPETMDADIVFIAVNTPGSHEGAADLRAVRDAVATVAPRLKPGAVIVNKSTVPIGTGDLVQGMVRRATSTPIDVVSNPEFLREGSAVTDFMKPDRVVLGSNNADAIEKVAALYRPLEATILKVDIRTAEMIKYASNAFLATKISFINEMAAICESLGADVTDVARGMGLDDRIGARFLSAGLGWGGSCFPKDVRALAHMATVHGTHPQLLRSVIEINAGQRLRILGRLRNELGGLERKRIAVLGAAFKPHTDDVRSSPAIELANLLALEGADVVVTDPVVRSLPGDLDIAFRLAESVHDAAVGASALVLATEWSEYLALDYTGVADAMAGDIFFDTRNAMNPQRIQAAGLRYLCVGRPSLEQPAATEVGEPAAMRVG